MQIKRLLAATAAIALLPTAAAAQSSGYYGSISGYASFQSDSENDGEFTSDFLTGQGSDAVPAGTPLPAGTEVGWTTEFDTGYGLNAALGKRLRGGFRGEVEFSYESADVDTHVGVSAAGLDLTAQDAAVLTGSETPLGATVGAVVADGQGSLETIGLYANAYYDFANASAFTPYVGGGIGWNQTDVDYSPSGVEIIDDSGSGFAWQVMGGASYQATDTTEIFGGIRYRSSEAEVDASLFPAEFDVENDRVIGEVGIRFGFN